MKLADTLSSFANDQLKIFSVVDVNVSF